MLLLVVDAVESEAWGKAAPFVVIDEGPVEVSGEGDILLEAEVELLEDILELLWFGELVGAGGGEVWMGLVADTVFEDIEFFIWMSLEVGL